MGGGGMDFFFVYFIPLSRRIKAKTHGEKLCAQIVVAFVRPAHLSIHSTREIITSRALGIVAIHRSGHCNT